MAALTAALLGLAGGAAYKSLTQKGPDTPTPIAPPAAPVVDPAIADAKARQQARIAQARTSRAPGLSSTLLTGPSGVTAPAPVRQNTLLGQ